MEAMGAAAGRFNGGVALVTGAARGIGAAVAAGLAQQGVKVAAVDIDADQLETFCSGKEGLSAFAFDLREAVAVESAVSRIERELGAVDYLVNVAGILRMSEAIETTDEDWLQSFAVNTHGVFYMTRAVARGMRERRRGSIVTVGSNAASTPRTRMAAYAASKAATSQFMRCLGLELAEYGIRCNLVSPGSTDTDMQRRFWREGAGSAEQVIAGSLESYRLGIPLRKIATPEDIAQAVLFLLSNAAGHITLQDLIVDGGATLG